MKFKFTWPDLFWILYGFIWRLSVSIVVAVMGTLVYALANDKLSSFESNIHGPGTWMWDTFSWAYFAVMIGFILWVWFTWYKQK